jgi:N-acetylmuramoyl-L-alanine amidase
VTDPPVSTPRYSDRSVLVATLYGEARNQPVLGMAGVLSVIRTRKAMGHWGHTWQEVCLAPAQFSCWNPTDPNRALLLQYVTLLESNAPIPAADLVLKVCGYLVDLLLTGALPDPTLGASHYYATSLRTPPSWTAPPATRTTVIGQHSFWTGVRVGSADPRAGGAGTRV